MADKTMRRDVLRRMIEAGKLEARCASRYTDDYAGDAENNFGKTDWLPVTIGRRDEVTPAGLVIDADHFASKPWLLTVDGDGTTIRFCPYQALAYDLRKRQEAPAVAAPAAVAPAADAPAVVDLAAEKAKRTSKAPAPTVTEPDDDDDFAVGAYI